MEHFQFIIYTCKWAMYLITRTCILISIHSLLLNEHLVKFNLVYDHSIKSNLGNLVGRHRAIHV